MNQDQAGSEPVDQPRNDLQDNSADPTEVEAQRTRRLFALGLIAERAAAMELTLRAVVTSLIGSPRAAIITAGQPVTWLVDNAVAIVDRNEAVRGESLGDSSDVDAFRAALKRCGELYRERNDALHGAWIYGANEQLFSKFKKPLIQTRAVTVTDLDKIGTELEVATSALLAASSKIKGLFARN
jgi:hypothetical protein